VDPFRADASDETIDAVLERTDQAYQRLAELGEAVDDEWSYIQDLTEAWRTRWQQVSRARGHEPLGPEIVRAIDTAIAEIGLITDPHRAIDWLSTFPQVTLVALGETP
jgi:hypothetical protein